jgi:hypothetical protein
MINDVILEGIVVKTWSYAGDLIFRLACYRGSDFLARSSSDVQEPADFFAVLQPKGTPGALVEAVGPRGWRLSIPGGPASEYRWAQLDDYRSLPRRSFLWRAPFALELRARVSDRNLPGTWGFGLWNDPFTAGLGVGGTHSRLPALPNAAWFFHASAPNHLAFHDTHPAQGFLAATFSSPPLPSPLLGLGLPLAPLLAVPAAARLLRRMLGLLINEDALRLEHDVTGWHSYRLEWQRQSCRFLVDGRTVLNTHVAPRGPLGLVLWIDNQYAAFPPEGRLRSGQLENPAAR